MTEGVAGKPFFPSEPFLMEFNVPWQIVVVDGFGVVGINLREEPSHRLAISSPVVREEIEGIAGKDGIAVTATFTSSDVDPHVAALDVFIPEVADFPGTKTGGIKKSDHGFFLQIGQGRDKGMNLLSGGNKGKVRIELAHGNLVGVPGLM